MMPTLRFSLLSLCFALTVVTGFAQEKDAKTLVKTLDPNDATNIVIDVPFNVKGESWKETNIRILLNVRLANANEALLKQLIAAGRYNVEGRKDSSSYIVYMPNIKKEVTIKGTRLEESVSADVLLPDGIMITCTDGKGAKVENQFIHDMTAKGLATKSLPPFHTAFPCTYNCSAGGNAADVYAPGDVLIDGKPLGQ